MADAIAFFDLETTVPSRPGQGFALLEFGAILVCPLTLVEVDSFSTLIRPADLSSVSTASVRCNGITRDAVATAPPFHDVADKIYSLLHGRVWAGHNIIRFDCVRIREAFAEIDHPAPEPKGTIDSLALLTQRFGRRAGNMKMATLATYFGLGEQKHRSLDDVRMTLEVLKYCATVLFLSIPSALGICDAITSSARLGFAGGTCSASCRNLDDSCYRSAVIFESSLPEVLMTNNWVSQSAAARNCNINTSREESCCNQKSPLEVEQENCRDLFPKINSMGGTPTHDTSVMPNSRAGPFNLIPRIDLMKIDSCQSDLPLDKKIKQGSSDTLSSRAALSEVCRDYAGFLDPDEVVRTAITASSVPAYHGCSRIVLLHKNVLLQLCCTKLEVRFRISAKFQDHAGRPRLNIVADAPPSVCQVLDVCDQLAWKLFVESGSSSEWRPVVTRKDSFPNSSTIRLNIPTIANGDGATYKTEIYQKEASGCIHRLVFNCIDVAELDSLLIPGTFIDAYFKLDTYEYQQSAGIRLVAKCLIVHSK